MSATVYLANHHINELYHLHVAREVKNHCRTVPAISVFTIMPGDVGYRLSVGSVVDWSNRCKFGREKTSLLDGTYSFF